ncbi:RNA polymerase sigma factor [Alcaligenes endophyticus]|uniref:RNA polymerase sigma factor n=1 Tax=Alcaligenes endophyticus TaxID=1929088 RepID=A0ABT8EFG3_9BURK|nr:RNA polymerase sigma factor [Alcaligenes endophyticus]MCX5590285.1 RNA polymerase sigma factor [Alcaligenes endophyticus]MDN4120051.1 RNA polymerase sigma factor [Alcaligenes endophyticus]
MLNKTQKQPNSLAQTEEDLLFRDLVQEHSTRLYRFIVKHIGHGTEAEELTQQAFVEAVSSYRNFRGESQLSTWLYGIALNLVRNYLSRAPERRYEFLDDGPLESSESEMLSPDDQLEQGQMLAALHAELQELPEHMRELLLLVGIEDVSYEEAAALLSVPVGTIRSRLSRARAALKQKLQARGVLDD